MIVVEVRVRLRLELVRSKRYVLTAPEICSVGALVVVVDVSLVVPPSQATRAKGKTRPRLAEET